MKKGRFQIFTLLALLFVNLSSGSGEIGFIEDFALSENREKALKQLIPGTKDYYYYTCLYLQGEGRIEEVEGILKQWIKRYKHTGRVIEIENRQALLRYIKNPQTSLSFIAQRLGLHFNHQREIPGREKKLPVRLDNNLISRDTLTRRALSRYSGTVEGFTANAFDWLINQDLSADRRRHLLGRLQRPDYRNLPELIVDDLNYKHSRGFGSHTIHSRLILSQLMECLKLKPDLLNQSNFVNIYLSKIKPNPDVDWRNNVKARELYIDRIWSFVSKLNPSHNSLKVHVLYHRLVHDRAQGIYNKSRFMEYIALPRNASYVNSDYINSKANRPYRANLSSSYNNITLFPPVRSDENVVRSFLSHFFENETSFKPYDKYINDIYLKRCFAETKIVNGIGDMEQWYSMLPLSEHKKLKERIDIDFAYTNKTSFNSNEPVVLDLYIKNIESLNVKVFEINTLNYYSAYFRQVRTDIDLDGLVANQEKTYKYNEAPLRRVKTTFEFPGIKKSGVFVIEFIGNGKSSRAVIRRGSLHYILRNSTVGHIFSIFNESNQKLPDAELILAGHHYKAEEDGTITVPYTNKPGRQPIILLNKQFACLDSLSHEKENYHLNTGFYVDRETLLNQKKAQVIIRPSLLLNSVPVTLSILEDITLSIETQDRENVKTTKEIKDFKLFEDKESVYEFKVPANLSSISFSIQARIQNLSQNKKITLRASKSFPVNEMDKTEKITAIHCIHAGGEYALEVMGKTGEPIADKAIELKLIHMDFRNPVVTVLRTDNKGRIYLGKLKDITYISTFLKTATNPKTYQWFCPLILLTIPA